MPALITLKTNLKSLGYGDDRPGGASSNQPYIQTPIPEGRILTSPDFLLRNGYLNPQNSLEDVSRLTKYFTDTKSPSGILFTTKQELLERQNPKLVNIDRVYNPISTTFQVGLVSTGGHLNKQGISPNEPSYYVGGKYGYYFATKNQTISDGIENRLTIAYTAKVANQELGKLTINPFGITNAAGDNILLSYPGGPGSTLGIGNTNIRIQNSTRTVEDIKEDQKFLITFGSTDPKNKFYLNPNTPTPYWSYNTIQNNGLFGWGASAAYIDLASLGNKLEQQYLNSAIFGENLNQNKILNRNITDTIYTPKTNLNGDNDEYVFDYSQLQFQSSRGVDKSTSLNSITDFRRTINIDSGEEVLPSTKYTVFNRERQIGEGGYQGSVTTYKGNYKGVRIIDPNIAISLDQNELGVTGEDIIDFNFTIILNDNPSDDQNRLIDFKAYIENWSDSAQGDWSGIKYMGRAENFYKYNGFSRVGSVTFVVPALSRGDMISNYRKLNALMWTVAPSYSTKTGDNIVPGLMRGSITKFTMGNYFRGMPCIIKSINYTEVEGMGWDINRDITGSIMDISNDLYVGQLPKGIRVQVEFTPLHNFVPQYGEAFVGQDEIYTPPTSSKSIWRGPEDKRRTTSRIDSTI